MAYQVGSGYPMMLDAATGKALDYRGVESKLEGFKEYEVLKPTKGDGNPPLKLRIL